MIESAAWFHVPRLYKVATGQAVMSGKRAGRRHKRSRRDAGFAHNLSQPEAVTLSTIGACIRSQGRLA